MPGSESEPVERSRTERLTAESGNDRQHGRVAEDARHPHAERRRPGQVSARIPGRQGSRGPVRGDRPGRSCRHQSVETEQVQQLGRRSPEGTSRPRIEAALIHHRRQVSSNAQLRRQRQRQVIRDIDRRQPVETRLTRDHPQITGDLAQAARPGEPPQRRTGRREAPPPAWRSPGRRPPRRRDQAAAGDRRPPDRCCVEPRRARSASPPAAAQSRPIDPTTARRARRSAVARTAGRSRSPDRPR